jgi:hypothetical protein
MAHAPKASPQVMQVTLRSTEKTARLFLCNTPTRPKWHSVASLCIQSYQGPVSCSALDAEYTELIRVCQSKITFIIVFDTSLNLQKYLLAKLLYVNWELNYSYC